MNATAAEQSGAWLDYQAASEANAAPARRRRGPAQDAGRPAPDGPQSAPLRLIAAEGRLLPRTASAAVRTSPGTAPAPRPTATPRLTAMPRPAPSPAPVRLTRRGRLVVTAAALLVIAAMSVVLAGAAQALGHSGGPARLGPGITKVEVRPGQDLWSLAETYDPNADTRQVIQEILQLNSMSTDQVQPGQVLWMPRD